MLGLLGKLLTLPYSLPKAGIGYCFDKIIEVAEAEYYDDASTKEQLLLLQLQLEDGEIDETEYRRREAPLLVRLREIKQHRQEQVDAMIAQRKAEGQSGDVVIELPDELR